MIIHVSDALFFGDDIFHVHDLPTDFDKSNTTCVTSGAGTAYPSGAPQVILVFSGVRVAQSLVFCVMLYRLPLCCLSVDLRLLITTLVSSNISYICRVNCWPYLLKFLFIML